jgi:hypothetical protein
VFDCLVAQACGCAPRSVLGTVSASRRNRQRNLVDAVQTLHSQWLSYTGSRSPQPGWYGRDTGVPVPGTPDG